MSEMQRIVNERGGAVVPLFNSYVQAANTRVFLPEVQASNWDLDGQKCYERWWFT